MIPSFTLHIMSDGTGETASAVARAVLVQYKQDQVNIIRHQNIRTKEQALSAIEKIQNKEKSLLIYTIVLPEIRKVIQKICQQKK